MKALKINSLKMLVNFSFVILLLLNACAQSGNQNNPQSENNANAGSVAEALDIDLQTAVITGNLEAVKLHIEAGTDINRKDQMTGSTPLISAVTFGKPDIVKALIDADADLNLKNNDGSTALHAAAFFCHIEMVQMLIDANADKTLTNNFGATARETVIAPFEDMKPIYELMQQQLQPFGLTIDLEEVEKTRPVIAMMLQ